MKDERFIDPLGSADDADRIWETFHENSKTSTFDMPPSDDEVLAHLEKLAESLEYYGRPLVELPRTRAPLTLGLGEAMLHRAS